MDEIVALLWYYDAYGYGLCGRLPVDGVEGEAIVVGDSIDMCLFEVHHFDQVGTYFVVR